MMEDNLLRTTTEQLQLYANFCKDHPEILSRKNPTLVSQLWNELTNNLNTLRGPTRTPKKWKECLANWKKQVRCRSRKAKMRKLLKSEIPFKEGIDTFDEQSDELSYIGTEWEKVCSPAPIHSPALEIKAKINPALQPYENASAVLPPQPPALELYEVAATSQAAPHNGIREKNNK